DAFRPFLPEFFTSPGGKALPVRFDSSGNEYARIQKRTSPLIASVDGANTTFFTSDTARDDDTLPNFFGTSAAAPHAAAIAALVLDKHGGGKSVKPAKMKRILSKSVFKHDLDPSESAGKAGKVTITATGDQGDERSPYVGPNRDPNFFRVSNAGGVPVSSITFFGAGASPTALGNGIVFDPRPNTGVPPFREQGFPFTVGGTSGGLNAGSVSATFAGAGGGQSVAGQFRNMTVHFGQGLRKGQAVSFGVDRDLTVSGVGLAAEGNSADELGGAVSIPDGRVLRDGMRFKAVLANGSVVRGVFRNDLGTGYTPVDGFGLLDAVAAVF
ncbi:MAG TPA: peptidase S53, partial [Nocardioides bacterium]|nr:peptidase S53 [Nocardioides sp.]